MTGPSNDALQVCYGTIPLLGGILLAAWNQNKRLGDLGTALNKRIDDLNVSLNKRIDDLATKVDGGFKQVNERLGKVEDRVTDLEKGIRLIR